MPKDVWVYLKTNIPYDGPVDGELMQHIKFNQKTGLVETGTLLIGENQTVTLELISQRTQKQRAAIWVYKGTSIAYEESFNIGQLQHTKVNPKTGFVQEGMLVKENQTIPLERISMMTQRKRSEVWVYAGTSIVYEKAFSMQQLQQTKVNPENGLIVQGVLLAAGNKSVALELISYSAQRYRAKKQQAQAQAYSNQLKGFSFFGNAEALNDAIKQIDLSPSDITSPTL